MRAPRPHLYVSLLLVLLLVSCQGVELPPAPGWLSAATGSGGSSSSAFAGANSAPRARSAIPLPPISDAISSGPPPYTPRWAYEPWVWEDDQNTAQSTLDLVDDYRSHDLSLGAVIIDSPWQTNYNTFEFGPNYPDPAGLLQSLHEREVKVLLWATPFINVQSIDGPQEGKASNYDEALARGYFVANGRTFEWDKGRGSAIDFFNPDAVAWLYGQMDKAFLLGFDGLKVDSPEGNLPDYVQTAAGPKTEREYGRAYYRAFYRYVAERKPDGIITARPSDSGTLYAPVDANPAGWVGDQDPVWGGDGLASALDNILASAELGYAVLGSDIGGYRKGARPERLFIRWTQLGALSPLMETGGRGEHRPWKIGPQALGAYRAYAKLHHQLVPYLYSLGVEAHLGGPPIIRNVDRKGQQYTLGDDLLVAPIVKPVDERQVTLPAGTPWHDYWTDDRVLSGPSTIKQQASLDFIPLYMRSGAILPLQADEPAGGLLLLLYPDGESVRTYYADIDRPIALVSRRDAGGVAVEIGPQTERYTLRIKESARPSSVQLQRDGAEVSLAELTSREELDRAAEGWFYDPEAHHLWARFATQESSARLSYAPGQ